MNDVIFNAMFMRFADYSRRPCTHGPVVSDRNHTERGHELTVPFRQRSEQDKPDCQLPATDNVPG